ncbi:MAG: thioredoxin fold domain-containing protein [Flavobacteriales bacterium]|nr:thioredoxin fold domain-containing protein [Flavobacteriales bacterium]
MSLKKILVVVFLFVGLGVNAQADYVINDPVSTEGWSNNANEVFKKAKAENAPMMLNFTGSDWCIWCKRIKAEIFDTPEFKAWAKEKNLQLLELDFPKNKKQSDELKAQNNSLKQEVGIQGFPTLIIISNGKMIRTGYVKGGAKAWIASVESQIEI